VGVVTTTISPSLGNGLAYTQGGVGTSPGYSAIDDRRPQGAGLQEGVIDAGSYEVTQRAAGANMSVDIAASVVSTVGGAFVRGDSVTSQGLYYVAPHTGTINEVIAAAHATLPRNDLVIVEIQDTAHDGSGANAPRTRVVTGTATAGAAQTDALGVNGTPTLPISAIPLAVVNVPATDTAITTAQIDDRRTIATNLDKLGVSGGGATRRGKSIITAAEARTNTAYGLLTTPDRVSSLVLPTDGLIFIAFFGLWTESVVGAAKAAIFIGSNQLSVDAVTSSTPSVIAGEAVISGTSSNNRYVPLASHPAGLGSSDSTTTVTDGSSVVTTGQAVAAAVADDNFSFTKRGGLLVVFAAAGTYDVSVQFKASGGATVTAKERRLWAWTMAF
jgi:hypothetical protein